MITLVFEDVHWGSCGLKVLRRAAWEVQMVVGSIPPPTYMTEVHLKSPNQLHIASLVQSGLPITLVLMYHSGFKKKVNDICCDWLLCILCLIRNNSRSS